MAQYDATTQVQDTRYLFPINTKSSSNASYFSVYATAQQSQVPLDISPESDHGNLTKAFAERAWQEDPSFIGQEELAEWFGSSSNIRQEALAHYIAHFEFGGLKVDEAIRFATNQCHNIKRHQLTS
ncbi:hypothetical protein RSOLAG1IB_06888 [Rhizoctonia solani AG-1 IB]|uniref:Uncharacterized protein n=1 Tax=Thanatephorus cucumeris (strain AG1-IB / isolate 7/3/14) TaxID=1108050 RepID=A0A0B7F9M4_THACB|nr:hypothetical protein RSOLAG1IB_06888 [Rhizoctonia solani AG-1 IB]